MLQVSVFTIKFWSIVSERRVSDFVNLSTITNHSKQHLYFEIENSTRNRSYLTSPNTRRNINVTNYSCMLEKAINYAGKTKLLLNLISRANFNFFKQLNKYQDELDRDLKRNTIWHSRRNSRLFIEHMFKILQITGTENIPVLKLIGINWIYWKYLIERICFCVVECIHFKICLNCNHIKRFHFCERFIFTQFIFC